VNLRGIAVASITHLIFCILMHSMIGYREIICAPRTYAYSTAHALVAKDWPRAVDTTWPCDICSVDTSVVRYTHGDFIVRVCDRCKRGAVTNFTYMYEDELKQRICELPARLDELRKRSYQVLIGVWYIFQWNHSVAHTQTYCHLCMSSISGDHSWVHTNPGILVLCGDCVNISVQQYLPAYVKKICLCSWLSYSIHADIHITDDFMRLITCEVTV